MSTRAEQRAATRARLVAAARERFAEHGYAAVSLPEVVAAAGVTKGALYHQFASKRDLFRAVLADVQAQVAAEVEAAAARSGSLLAGCEAFLRASTAPGVERIMLVDGPAVLGWAVWHACTSFRLTPHSPIRAHSHQSRHSAKRVHQL